MKFSEKVVTLTHVPKDKGNITPITVRFDDGQMMESYTVSGLGRITRNYKGEWYRIQSDGELKNFGCDERVPFKFQELSLTMRHMVEGAEYYLRSYEISENYEVYAYQACPGTFVKFMLHDGEWTATVRIGKARATNTEHALKILFGKDFWMHEADESEWHSIAEAKVSEDEIPHIMLRYLSTVACYN